MHHLIFLFHSGPLSSPGQWYLTVQLVQAAHIAAVHALKCLLPTQSFLNLFADLHCGLSHLPSNWEWSAAVSFHIWHAFWLAFTCCAKPHLPWTWCLVFSLQILLRESCWLHCLLGEEDGGCHTYPQHLSPSIGVQKVRVRPPCQTCLSWSAKPPPPPLSDSCGADSPCTQDGAWYLCLTVNLHFLVLSE